MPHLTYTSDGYPYYEPDDGDVIGQPQLPADVSNLQDYANTLSTPAQNPLPTHEPYVQTTGEKVASLLTGGMGQERYQLFPERIVRSALSLPTDVMTGKVQTPSTLRSGGAEEDFSSDPLLQRVQDMAALMGGGGVSMAEKGAVGSMGGKLVQPLDDNVIKGFMNKWDEQGVRNYVAQQSEGAGGNLKLHDLVVPKEQRGQGIGTQFMNELTDMADKSGKTIVLTAAKDYGATSLQRLKDFYKQFGFVENKGRNKDFRISDNMYRKPNNILKSDNEASAPVAALENAPIFHSAVENAVNTSSLKSAPPQQWLSTIQNAKGVKPEELDWTGLKDYLGEQSGPVSKEQVQQYLQQNKVGLQEVNKNEQSQVPAATRVNQIDQQLSDIQDEFNRLHQEHSDYTKIPDNVQQRQAQLAAQERALVDERARVVNNWQDQASGRTKYSKWQLPGQAENYREKLLTLPANLNTRKALADEYRQLYGDNFWDHINEEQKQNFRNSLPENYKSSHWDEPNIIAHIRMNDRNVEGKNALHIEEIQSDWHQQGREKGYKLSKEDEAKLEPEFNRIDDKIVNSGDEAIMGHPDINQAIKMAVDKKIITPDEAKSYLRYSDSQRMGAVPDAPFKKTWLDLALKRVIREAAEQGKDRISWTPGEAQAARYDLSKHIKEISHIKNPKTVETGYKGENTYDVAATAHNGSDVNIPNASKMTERDLENTFGKEIAKKIINDEGKSYRGRQFKTLEGLDLKVGGEGMHYFYDVMLPKALEKLTGEKMKVGKVSGIDNDYVLENKYGHYAVGGRNLKEAEAELARRNADDTGIEDNKALKWKIKDNRKPVNYIDLPQSVKDTALHKGFPLFSSGFMLNPVQSVPGLQPLRHDPFSQGNDSDPEVNNRNDVPYLAGASNTASGLPINVDRRMPRYDPKLKLPNGQPADLWKYLKVHELEEYKAMKDGTSYKEAHAKIATPAERAAVEADGLNWNEYTKVIDGYLDEIEHEKGKNIPPNLYTKPYAHDRSKLDK